MSPAFSKAEHTVINVGGEEFPRLISCVKASQGFDWNQGTYTILYPTRFDTWRDGSWMDGAGCGHGLMFCVCRDLPTQLRRLPLRRP